MNLTTKLWLAACAAACLGFAVSQTSLFDDAAMAEQAATNVPASSRTSFARAPMFFEQNQGQTDTQVRYLARGPGYGVFLTPTEAVFTLRSPKLGAEPSVLRMSLHGAKSNPTIEGHDLQAGHSHYFRGATTSGWQQDVPLYAKVQYEDVYAGVDVVYYGNQDKLEYDFIIAPGHDPGQISLDFAGVDKLRLDSAGNLVLKTAVGEIIQHKPRVYQVVAGRQRPVQGGYRLLADNRVGFDVGTYDHRQLLVIDPVLAYSSYLGGSGQDYVSSMVTDASGNLYVTGTTASLDFPGTTMQAHGGLDIFVSKFNPDTDVLLYSTYLGGSADDYGMSVQVDPNGNAYVVGHTASTDFPVANALQPAHAADAGLADAFVVKLDPTGGRLVYSTYLGGRGVDDGYSLVIDATGAAYIGGTTGSADFPITASALQRSLKGSHDGFVSKLNASGNGLVFSTYLGGSYAETLYAITIDKYGSVYAAGKTFSADFPQMPVQGWLRGSADAFVSKLSKDGSSLAFSTYLGGGGDERIMDIVTYEIRGSPSSSMNTYVVGRTNSTDFPSWNAYQATIGGGWDGFVTELNENGSISDFSTYLGGSGDDELREITMRGSLPSVVGFSNSLDYPVLNAVQDTPGGGFDAIYTQMTGGGFPRVSTYLGGAGDDYGWAIATYGRGNMFLAGETHSMDFPTLHARQIGSSGNGDAYVSRLGTRGFQSSYTHDFDADWAADLLWRNAQTGANTLWLSGDSKNARPIASMAKNWNVGAIGDFDCDGAADILWHDALSGYNRIWRNADAASVQAMSQVSNTAWQIAGVGDFNDGGCSRDVVWRNTRTGADVIWLSANSATPRSVTSVTNLDWRIAGIGDFDDDSLSDDILWHNTRTGASVIWKDANSRTTLPVTTVTNLAWQIVGLGDFYADGVSDILWRNNKTGSNVVWRSANSSTQQRVTGVSDIAWQVAAIGDYDGDGRSDIAWRNRRSGADAIWLSANITHPRPMTAVTNLAWAVVP